MTVPTPRPPLPAQTSPRSVLPGHLAPGIAADASDVFAVGAFQVHDDDVRVPLHGELDLATGPRLVAGLAPLADLALHTAPSAGPDTARDPAFSVVGSSRRGTVALEMSEVTFLDTSGLTALTVARTSLTAAGWRVCLSRPRPAVLRVLDFAIDAGWFPADTACADVEIWGQRRPTRMTLAPWPVLPTAAGQGAAARSSVTRGSSEGRGARRGAGGRS